MQPFMAELRKRQKSIDVGVVSEGVAPGLLAPEDANPYQKVITNDDRSSVTSGQRRRASNVQFTQAPPEIIPRALADNFPPFPPLFLLNSTYDEATKSIPEYHV